MIGTVGGLMAGILLVLTALVPPGTLSARLRTIATLGCGAIAVQYIVRAGDSWVSSTLAGLLIATGLLNLRRIRQQAVQQSRDPSFDPDGAVDVADDGVRLIRRFDLRGDVPALNDGIEKLRAAARAGSARQRPAYVTDLVVALRGRYDRLRDAADLAEAIDIARAAARSVGPDELAGVRLRGQLGAALRQRYDHFGDSGDLEEALTAVRQAVELTPAGNAERASWLAELSAVFHSRYGRGRDPRDLDAAIEALAIADAVAAPVPAERVVRLTNWCHLLTRRSTDDDLRQAVQVGIQAVRLVEPGYRIFPTAHNNLALALRLRYERTRDPDDRAEAVTYARLAADTAPADDPARPLYLANLAMALSLAGPVSEEALRVAESAASIPATDLVTRVTAGLVWCDLAASAGLFATAVRAFEGVIALLPLVAAPALPREDQERRLGRWAGVAVRAAACAVADGRPDHAVTLLERGRGVLLARELDARAGEQPDLPGLLAQSDDGPIVYLNFSQYRSDAVILEDRRVRTVELPGVSVQSMTEQLGRLTTALDPASQRQLLGLLEWIRATVTDPVLDALRHRPDRVWWIPTGPFVLLPVHAAALDRVASSYAPTIRALIKARSGALSRTPPSSLVVAMSTTPGGAPLPHARAEAELVSAAFPGARVLDGAQATAARVVAELTHSAWVHFACHAVTDEDSPSRGRLLLHDEPLTVREISALDLPGAELAFLSACETAHPGSLFDEAVTLASAFQLAGYPHVVGTLWPVLDRTGPDFARTVYRLLLEGRSPAEAVHRATLQARERYPNLPVLWAGHVHVGP